MRLKIYSCFFILLFLFTLPSCDESADNSVIPATSSQTIVVVTDSVDDSHGTLYCFERQNSTANWEMVGEEMPVVVGENGLGWGEGLEKPTNLFDYSAKQEGDGRSPAGIFNLSLVFGRTPKDQMSDLKMPYLPLTEGIECVDDQNSKYYNQIVDRDEIGSENVDWKSSEKMYHYDTCYELGVFVDHNLNPPKKGFGSCIFLHIWSDPDDSTAGCTAMEQINMYEIAQWLDIEKQPVLIQLTKRSYQSVLEEWGLPDINQ